MKNKLSLKSAIIFALIAILCAFTMLSACKKSNTIFGVEFFESPHHKSLLVNFSDGKTLLIDGGYCENNGQSEIVKELKERGVGRIDYLIITKPCENYFLSLENLIESFEIDLAFVPEIKTTSLFPAYENAVGLLKSKNIKIEGIKMGVSVKGENYFFAFLSPSPNAPLTESVNNIGCGEQVVNNSTPNIYLDYNGVRFLICGEGDESQVKYLLDNYKVGMYFIAFDSVIKNFSLSKLDFLVLNNFSVKTEWQELFSITQPLNLIITKTLAMQYEKLNLLKQKYSLTSVFDLSSRFSFGVEIPNSKTYKIMQ